MQTELSFSLIFNQSINFVKNRLWQIIVICVLLALFSVFLTSSLIDANVLEKAANPNDLSQGQLFEILWKSGLVTLINSLVAGGIIVATAYNLSISPTFNITLLISNALSTMLKIVSFNLAYAAILLFAGGILGLALFVISLILPSLSSLISILLLIFFVIFVMSAYFFFLGSIVEPSKKRFFELFVKLHQQLKKYWKLAVLMIAIRLIVALLVGTIAMRLESNLLVSILLSTIANLMDFVVICFFYRLSTLIANNDNNSTELSNM